MIRPPSAFISTKIGNRIAVLTLSRPPAGRFSQSLRAELEAVLSEIFTTPDIDAIVITGEGAAFDIDLPLAERQLGQASPSLDVLTTLISHAPMPVVAALRGRITDAGLELALAAQARVIHHASRVCLPSLQLGQLPSAAAIYTLTTTLGPRFSIKLLETLSDIPASQPRLAPLFDKIVVQNVVGEAAELARSLHVTPKNAPLLWQTQSAIKPKSMPYAKSAPTQQWLLRKKRQPLQPWKPFSSFRKAQRSGLRAFRKKISNKHICHAARPIAARQSSPACAVIRTPMRQPVSHSWVQANKLAASRSTPCAQICLSRLSP